MNKYAFGIQGESHVLQSANVVCLITTEDCHGPLERCTEKGPKSVLWFFCPKCVT